MRDLEREEKAVLRGFWRVTYGEGLLLSFYPSNSSESQVEAVWQGTLYWYGSLFSSQAREKMDSKKERKKKIKWLVPSHSTLDCVQGNATFGRLYGTLPHNNYTEKVVFFK